MRKNVCTWRKMRPNLPQLKFRFTVNQRTVKVIHSDNGCESVWSRQCTDSNMDRANLSRIKGRHYGKIPRRTRDMTSADGADRSGWWTLIYFYYPLQSQKAVSRYCILALHGIVIIICNVIAKFYTCCFGRNQDLTWQIYSMDIWKFTIGNLSLRCTCLLPCKDKQE